MSPQTVWQARAFGNAGVGLPKTSNGLTIGLINAMPDAALRATEKQFCSLLLAASDGMNVQLKFYALPGVARSELTQAHIDAHYEDFAGLAYDPPDGIIMTGTEPRAAELSDEPFWPAMSRVIRQCYDGFIPAIWSCLAAHAAVLEIAGIERVKLPGKLSGLFKCRVENAKHGLFYRLSREMWVPHSRQNGLEAKQLLRHGFDVVSRSPATGPDMFITRESCAHLFLQGHLEYAADSLIGEYQRDVWRAFKKLRADLPEWPKGYRPAPASALIARLKDAVKHGDAAATEVFLSEIMRSAAVVHPWQSTAVTLFRNWLTYVDGRKQRASCANGVLQISSLAY